MFFSGSCGCPIRKLFARQVNPRPQSFCISVLAIIVFYQSCVRVYGHTHINFSIHQASYRIHSYHSHLPPISFLLDRNPCLPAGREPVSVVSTGIEPVSRASETLILSIVLRDQYFKYPFSFNLAQNPCLPAGREPVSKASETSILSVVLRDQYFKYPFCFWSRPESCLPAGLPTGGREPVSRASETLILSIVLRDQLFHYFINPATFELKIFTAMASKTTPKNFRTAVNPAGPNNFAMYFNE